MIQEEIQRLNNCITELQEENYRLSTSQALDAAKSSISVPPETASLSSKDKESLSLLNEKLGEATRLYHKVTKDLHRYQQVSKHLMRTCTLGTNISYM